MQFIVHSSYANALNNLEIYCAFISFDFILSYVRSLLSIVAVMSFANATIRSLSDCIVN